MGTHISRVKSVDLDAWTDEQLQSVLRWGNARANKYWEAKLAAGHVPSDGWVQYVAKRLTRDTNGMFSKIENFIRTKYESKRWVMDGPMPDPVTLDEEGDDDVVRVHLQDSYNADHSTIATQCRTGKGKTRARELIASSINIKSINSPTTESGPSN